MKKIIGLILLFSVVGCKEKKELGVVFSFDEKDYKLIRTLNDENGKKYSEDFINLKDTTLRLRKVYWDNSKLKAEVFFSNYKQVGPYRFFDTSENLRYEGFFLNNKENGVTIKYDETEKKVRIENWLDGNIIDQRILKHTN